MSGGKPTPGTPTGLAALAALRSELPAGPAPTQAPPPLPPKGPARAVVRLERKGRGGKEATVIEKLALAPAELERWCKELKAALGCGGVVDGEAIVLQGDLRPRLEAVLTKRGVRKVTIAG
ncbi:MAG: translation initiation factor [Kofleriaceae bacterium]|jgi:translation initiation factor 1|nr:translation initiation factor [Kofleriaceae bacterium]MBP9168247.1 translation initiation factor [Kofleriaceae bacterium]MBP9860276.1 translation initiation factor [Kofleriaceae bacterium]